MVDVMKGDYGYDLSFTVTDSGGTPLDLSGGSVWFKTGVANTNTTNLSGACTIVTAGSGTCTYTVGSGDFNTAGNYQWELETIYTDKVLTTDRTENIVVKDNLGA